jgi:hypothetical protein
VRHAAAREPPQDRRCRLDLLEWNRLGGGNELEQVAELERLALVHELGEPLVVVPAGAVDRRAELVGRGPLQRGDDVGVRGVPLTSLSKLDVPGALELRLLRAGRLVPRARVALELCEPDGTDRRRGLREAGAEHVVRQPDRLEHLGATIGVDVRDAHLRHHLEDPGLDGAAEASLRVVRRGAAELVRCTEVGHRVEREARADSVGAVSEEAGEVVHLSRLIARHDERRRGAKTGLDKGSVDGGDRKERREREAPLSGRRVVEQQDFRAAARRCDGVGGEPAAGGSEALVAERGVENLRAQQG